METLTKEEISELAAQTALKAIETLDLKNPVRRFVPGDGGIPQEDKDLDTPKFKTFGEYLKAVADHFVGRFGS